MKLTKSFIKQVIMEEMQAMQEVGSVNIAEEVATLAELVNQGNFSEAVAKAEEVLMHLKKVAPDESHGSDPLVGQQPKGVYGTRGRSSP